MAIGDRGDVISLNDIPIIDLIYPGFPSSLVEIAVFIKITQIGKLILPHIIGETILLILKLRKFVAQTRLTDSTGLDKS